VIVDDLDNKDWLAATRDDVFCGLRQALETSVALRTTAKLPFVVPPIRAVDRAAVLADSGMDLSPYHAATAHRPDPIAMTLYRLRWFLDDTASAVRLFRNAHRDTADTRRWSAALASQIEPLDSWLARLT
jgi:hypothetical protein